METKKTRRVKITWSVDEQLVKRVKHEAIDRDTSASSIVEEALRNFLSA